MLDFERVINIPTPLIHINDEIFLEKGVEVYVKRDDLTHPFISGNKFRKLKYNLLEAEEKGISKLLTFGGAYSNHLSAFAFACKAFGFEGKCLVRGEELTVSSSPTLSFAHEQGLELEFVSRESYRDKVQLAEVYGKDYFVIPEGGSNNQALKGVGELIGELGDFNYLVTACGTGGTMAGLLKNAKSEQNIVGVSALKGGDFLREDIARFLHRDFPENATLLTDFHFGGYAKYNSELLGFIDNFEAKHGIVLEQVYTGKAFFAFYELLKQDYFKPKSKIILLHTGGLQGKI